MKTILLFDTEKEDDNFYLEEMMAASKALRVINDITSYFRAILKYNKENLTEKQLDAIDKINNHIYELINNYEINEVLNR
jgi:hypothetical protein